MPDESWWPHRPGHRPCDCPPRPVPVTVELKDGDGNVKDVRYSEFFVRPHPHHHGWHEDDLNH